MSMHVTPGDCLSDSILLCGGLQQYLIQQNATQQPRKGAGSEFTTFHDLPDTLQLEIFTFLGAVDLSRISRVCRHWYSVSCDESLWKRRLKLDVCTWNVIGSSTNPDFYANESSDFTSKEIYIRCSPVVNQLSKQQFVGFHRLSDLLRSFWPKKTPKLAMFGPGLETSTSNIVRKIIDGQSHLFSVVRLFPGQFGGVGTGFTLQTSDDGKLDVVMLYTASQGQREHQTAAERAQRSQLMVSSGTSSPQAADCELQPAIKDLCRTLDGLVYVIDASVGIDDIEFSQAELSAMLNEQWTSPGNPVVILACVPNEASLRLNTIELIRKLQLTSVNRPWQIHSCVVESMAGIESAFHWIVQTCRRT